MSETGQPETRTREPGQESPQQRRCGPTAGRPQPANRGTKCPGKANQVADDAKRSRRKKQEGRVGTCRHCQGQLRLWARGLCSRCYGSYRDQYAPLKTASTYRAPLADFYGRARGIPSPCPAPCGSEAKLLELERRASLGLELHVQGDECHDAELSRPVAVHRSGSNRSSPLHTVLRATDERA